MNLSLDSSVITKASSIPQFYFGSPRHARTTSLQIQVQKLAQQQYVEQMSKRMWNEEEQQELEQLIHARGQIPVVAFDRNTIQSRLNTQLQEHEGNEEMCQRFKVIQEKLNPIEEVLTASRVDYATYCSIRDTVASPIAEKMTAKLFLQFKQDGLGRINGNTLASYLSQINRHLETFLSLLLYDPEATGYLSPLRLQDFLQGLIATTPAFLQLTPSFTPFYIMTAVRKFLFFHDPRKLGKLYVKDLVVSPVLKELLHFAQQGEIMWQGQVNWFSIKNAQQVYRQYLSLDIDKNGLLSKSEFMKYGKMKPFRKGRIAANDLLPVFVDRVFEESEVFEPDNEMDYNGFLDFKLAMDNKTTQPSLRYFWKLFDFQHRGYLDRFTLRYFLRSLHSRMEATSDTVIELQDLEHEVLDMIKPKNSSQISYKDLSSCGVAHHVVGILSDLVGFSNYECRQAELPDEDPETEREASWPW